MCNFEWKINEMEMMCKEGPWHLSQYHHSICLEEL